MPDPVADAPASLQVFRYRAGDDTVYPVIGEAETHLPIGELVAQATEALHGETFTCHAVSQLEDFGVDELCFVPRGDRCEILCIRTNGWKRHHGDHRRSLVEILNNLAAAVACGKLRILDETELQHETRAGEELMHFAIDDPATLTTAREAVDVTLRECRLDDLTRQRTILCISEATTNMLLHGGGQGSMTLRRLDGHLRIVVADEGQGMNFLNWIDPPATKSQTSMGYGFKIILDYLDAVGLRTGRTGTTLLLDRKTD